MKFNNSDNYEAVKIYLTKETTPIAWEQRVISNMNSGASREDAEILASEPIEVEMYYNVDAGLFLIETDAVESGTIYDPYSGDLFEDFEED